MGLDIVAMVIELEREFNVDLPDAELRVAESVVDVFTLIQLRTGKVSAPSAVRCDGADWIKYVDVIERETGLERSRIVPQARFIRDLGLG